MDENGRLLHTSMSHGREARGKPHGAQVRSPEVMVQ